MEKLRKLVLKLAQLINAPSYLLPTFEKSEDFARPHIETQGNEYHYVIVERGQELERKKTTDLNQIIFWIFESVTFSMALKIELANRIEGEDIRIQLFKIQEELIEKVNPEFKLILEKKHKKLLR
ncbi:MAG: Imm63 family immunity protein [Bacteroidota bacterium]